MLEPVQPHSNPVPCPPPGLAEGSRLAMAKWPPDDDDDDTAGQLPAGGGGGDGGIPVGGGGGGGFDAGDGNFKKGATKPIAIVIGLLVVGAFVAFLAIGFKADAERIEVKDAAAEKARIMVLPKKEQDIEWRKWAGLDSSPFLREEALKQLAYAGDPQGVRLAILALKDPNVAVVGQAARALAYYGLPAAEAARQPLLEALKKSGGGSKPQIAWALVELEEPSAVDEVLALYRVGHLAKVKRLDDGVAFDPEKLAKVAGNDKLATLVKDESPAVRQLVATALSKTGDAKYTDALIALIQDKSEDVAREAAPGLGKIGDEKARAPLVAALRGASNDSRKKYLDALRDGIGTAGLVLALSATDDKDEKKGWFQNKQIFQRIRALSDPRGGDSLYAFIGTKPHIHWQVQAAMSLAEIGDTRGVPVLAKRLRMKAKKIYEGDHDYMLLLQRDGHNERVEATRMMADLARLHPEKHEEMRVQAEDALIFYAHDQKAPHANTLRALAYMGSTKDMKALRNWSLPKKALPLEGQQGQFPLEWTITQSALRYLGAYKDKKDKKELLDQLKRRDPEVNLSKEALVGAGRSMLAMVVSAITKGAADGISEWGDPEFAKPLLEFIEDPKEHEDGRMKACRALAWVATPEDLVEVAKKITEYNKPDTKDQFRRACLLETLIEHPVPGTASALLPLLNKESSMGSRHKAARAIGVSGVDEATATKLFELMKEDALRLDAALALILGADSATAARAIAMFDGRDSAELDELSSLWYNTFHVYSQRDLDSGRLFRIIDNATAVSRVTVRYKSMIKKTAEGEKKAPGTEVAGVPQQWARALLTRDLDLLIKDRGPHSMQKTVLRRKLFEMAKGKDAEKRAGALRALLFMKEQGVLLALKDDKGEVGKEAAKAYFELMNPKVVMGVKDVEKEKRQ